MAVQNFIDKINLIVLRLAENRANDALLFGRESLALIRRRIQNTGKDANEMQFGDYSTTDLPAFFFAGRSINASGENAVSVAKSKEKKLSYKDFRNANNLETDFVNLTFTGAMWREMDVKITTNTPQKSTATITPTTPRTIKVLSYNITRYGNILDLTTKERGMLLEANKQRVLKIFKQVLKK